MIEVQLNSSITSMPASLPRLQRTSPGGMIEPFNEYRDVGTDRGKVVAFDLQPARRDVAKGGEPELAAAFDVDRRARLEPRHRPPFAGLTDQLAVQESDHVDAVVKPHAKLVAAGPGDLSSSSLAGFELDRRLVAERRRKIASETATPSALILRIEQALREPAI